MTPDRIIDEVRSNELLMHAWEAWREVRKKYGYGPTYRAYLRTPEWREFRNKLIAARPKCECCLEKDSCEVHHLSYRYVFFENAAMMQAVCAECHEMMTCIDNYEKRERNREK